MFYWESQMADLAENNYALQPERENLQRAQVWLLGTNHVAECAEPHCPRGSIVGVIPPRACRHSWVRIHLLQQLLGWCSISVLLLSRPYPSSHLLFPLGVTCTLGI